MVRELLAGGKKSKQKTHNLAGNIFGQAFKQAGFHREFYALSGKYFRNRKCCVVAGVGALWSGLGLYGTLPL